MSFINDPSLAVAVSTASGVVDNPALHVAVGAPLAGIGLAVYLARRRKAARAARVGPSTQRAPSAGAADREEAV